MVDPDKKLQIYVLGANPGYDHNYDLDERRILPKAPISNIIISIMDSNDANSNNNVPQFRSSDIYKSKAGAAVAPRNPRKLKSRPNFAGLLVGS